jgi:drug/metabolite transporter (DMT)-like permease
MMLFSLPIRIAGQETDIQLANPAIGSGRLARFFLADGGAMQRANQVMGATDWVLLVCLASLWGGSFFFSKVALAELRPFTVVLGRVSIAAAVLHVVVIASGHRMPGSIKLWSQFFVMGALNNLLPFSLIFWGQTRIASGLAAILNSTTPLFTAVFAHFLTRDERLTPNRLVGILLGIAGVSAMMGEEALGGLSGHVIAQIAVLGAAACYGLAGIYGRRFKGITPVVTATGQVTATSIMILPVALIADQPWTLAMPSALTWGAVVGLAVLSTALAYILYFRILATAGPTNLLLVTFLIPVSALLLGTMILGEHLGARHLGGMALIALGLAAMDGRPLQLFKRSLIARRAPSRPPLRIEHSPQSPP